MLLLLFLITKSSNQKAYQDSQLPYDFWVMVTIIISKKVVINLIQFSWGNVLGKLIFTDTC